MICSGHIGDADKLYYGQWHDKAAESQRRGQRQTQCSECKHWYWPWERKDACR